jgi:hypothetical protein
MIKLFNTLFIVAVLSAITLAQDPYTKPVSERNSKVEDAERSEKMDNLEDIADAKLDVEKRSVAIRTLGLTGEEIAGFTPIYMDYQNAKDRLTERRNLLVKEYQEEMKEDNSVKSEQDEVGDFIENFWEIDIAEMELKKDMFDQFEDEIGPQKALDFFAMEEMMINRAKRNLVIESLPAMRFYVPVTSFYLDDINAFRNWNRMNIAGNVVFDHDFTYNGLEKLLNAAERMAMAEGIVVTNFPERKSMIMNKASTLKENWKSMKHADLAREAFTATASLLGDIADDRRFNSRDAWIIDLSDTAKMIDPSVKLTDQAGTVYSFFNTAEMIINDLASQANSSK